MHAAILHAFGEQSQWGLRALAVHLKLDAATLKRRMLLWLNRGFVHEVGRSADGDVQYESPTHLGSGGERRQAGEDEDEGRREERNMKMAISIRMVARMRHDDGGRG